MVLCNAVSVKLETKSYTALTCSWRERITWSSLFYFCHFGFSFFGFFGFFCFPFPLLVLLNDSNHIDFHLKAFVLFESEHDFFSKIDLRHDIFCLRVVKSNMGLQYFLNLQDQKKT